MRLGIFAKTFLGTDPTVVLAQAKAAGFASVQYNMACSGLPSMPDAISDAVVHSIADAATSQNLAIAAVSGTYNMIHPDNAVREAGLRRLEMLAAASAGIGTSLITLCTGTRDPDDQWRHHPDNTTPEAWADLLTEMAKAATIAERYNIKLGIEPELSNVVDSAARARSLLDAIGSPSLAIVLDPANLFEHAPLPEQRDIISHAIDVLGDRIIMGHAKDRTADGEFVTAGTGVLDYRHYFGRLRAVGFDGDMITHGLTADEAPAVAAFLSRMLQ
ncbi:sugar phosphate isomerase/epimerase [Devosia sp. 2618]|uniref:sugar phosphate isomerase/epimerase family protein n=1 Tax=Devosia sp. 2618 TaxID=3156454 RepID=UPI003396F8FD